MNEEMQILTEGKSLEAMGHFLRTERERQGLTRRDLASRTRIPLDQLDFIEDGKISSLPPVFAKGFLRAYAVELGLDAETLLDDYRSLTGGSKNQAAGSLTPKYSESKVNGIPTPVSRVLLIVIIVAAVLLAAYFFWPQAQEIADKYIPFLNSEQEVAVSPEAASTAPEAAVAGSAAPAAATTASPASSNANQSNAAVVNPVLQEGGSLSLRWLKDTWVQVVLDDGKAEYLNLKAGQERKWTAKKNIKITTGSGSALDVKWNDVDLGPLGEDRVMEAVFPRH